MELALVFGKVLRARRMEVGLTQEQLGFEAGLERNYISMLELGQRQPTLGSLFKLAAALRVSVSELVRQTEFAAASVRSPNATSR